jgi:hypothetical protein
VPEKRACFNFSSLGFDYREEDRRVVQHFGASKFPSLCTVPHAKL